MDTTKQQLQNAIEELNETEMVALISIIKEYKFACGKHPQWPEDQIHCAAIVAEESGELVRAALQFQYEKGGVDFLINESTQTGAMGMRFLVNVLEGDATQDLPTSNF